MKEVVKVSISGISFAFNDDAYNVLSSYLDKLERGYANNPDGREIIADIEARIVEIILSKQSSEVVVELPLTNMIIEQMGLPDDISQVVESEDGSQSASVEQFPRRLYRNKEGAKLGGVCSGISTFFNVDPVWVRLAIFAPLLILIFTAPMGIESLSASLGTLFGSLFLLYFILWLAIPIAKTPRQRLEMRGEKITVSSIHESFRQEASVISPSPRSQRSASVLAELVYVIGRIVLFGIKALALLIGFVIAISAIALIIGYFTISYGSDDIANQTLNILGGLHGITPGMFLTLAALVLLLPITLIVWLIMRLVFNLKTDRTSMSIILGIWLIILIYMAVISIKNFENIREGFRHADNKIELIKLDYDDGSSCDSTDLETISATITTSEIAVGDRSKRDTVKVVVSKIKKQKTDL